MNKIALSTQTYRADFEECKLLCKSIDLFVPNDIPHYIFVNDEDYDYFKSSEFFENRLVFKKSVLLPKYLLNIHKKLLGHQYYLSPCSIPIREWIIQQICKLSVFNFIDADIDAVINIDSEVVFLKPFEENIFINDNKFLLFKELYREEPNHNQYCRIGKKLLNLPEDINLITEYCYQSASVIFVRENIMQLQKQISSNTICGSWKVKLFNTYRFSEYYLYGLFNDYIYNMRNHFISHKRPFPMIDISSCSQETFLKEIKNYIATKGVQGVWLQKHQRNNKNIHLMSFDKIREIITINVFTPSKKTKTGFPN